MELMQLEMFLAVVEERSVRGAAERVFHPAGGQQCPVETRRGVQCATVRPLERYEYRLSPVGETPYGYSTRNLSLRNEAVAVVSELGNMRSRYLALGAKCERTCSSSAEAPEKASMTKRA
jgi:hypothetical protein